MALNIFFPKRLLPYSFLIMSLLLISWDICDNKCIINLFISKYILEEEDDNYRFGNCELIKISNEAVVHMCHIFLVLIIFFYLKPDYSLFNLIFKTVNYLNKYHI